MKLNILYIMHTWIDLTDVERTSIGGTTLHAYDIINTTKNKYNYFVLSVSNNMYILNTYIDGKSKVYNLGVKCVTYGFDKYNISYKKMLQKIIDVLKIDVIHIHHLLGHTYDILNVLNNNNKIKKIITIHDYFLACPQINLLYKSTRYCEKERLNKCKKCVNKNIDVKVRNNIVQQLLKVCDDVIIPNASLEKELKTFFKDVNYEVIEHGIDIKKYQMKSKNKNEKFNVAFVGVLEILKGSNLVKQIIKNNTNNKIMYHFWGTTSDDFFKHDRKNYNYHGEYKRQEICKILNGKVDLICLLTICPETYCYTLSEAIYSGIPILGINLGAIGNRIKTHDVGWLVEKDASYEDIIKKIEYIIDNRVEYNNKVENIKKINLKTTKEMVEEIISKYNVKYKKKQEKIDYDFEIVNSFNRNIIFKCKKIVKKVFKRKG